MNAAVALCPCCARPLSSAQPVIWDRGSATFTSAAGSVRFIAQQARFFDVLFRRRNAGPFYSAPDLLEAAYAGDPHGGPDVIDVVSVMLNRIRPRIEPLGFTITRNMGVPRQGYRLVPIEKTQR